MMIVKLGTRFHKPVQKLQCNENVTGVTLGGKVPGKQNFFSGVSASIIFQKSSENFSHEKDADSRMHESDSDSSKVPSMFVK